MALVAVGLDSVAIAGNLVIDAICVAVVGGSGAVVFVLEKFAALVFGRTSADTFIFEPHARRTCTEAVYTPLQRPTGRNVGEIDQAKTLAKSAFPLKPAKLVDKARNVIATMFGTLDHDVLADDFRFVAPVVGPLGKQEFIRVFGSFKLEDALPDLQENHWGFHVDPLEPNRVWWLSRPQGTHTGPLRFPPPNVIQPTNRAVQWPVQAQSMLFDEQGRCYQLTVGYRYVYICWYVYISDILSLSLFLLIFCVSLQLRQTNRKHWRSGRCVRLDARRWQDAALS
jgi:hypothetical protein